MFESRPPCQRLLYCLVFCWCRIWLRRRHSISVAACISALTLTVSSNRRKNVKRPARPALRSKSVHRRLMRLAPRVARSRTPRAVKRPTLSPARSSARPSAPRAHAKSVSVIAPIAAPRMPCPTIISGVTKVSVKRIAITTATCGATAAARVIKPRIARPSA